MKWLHLCLIYSKDFRTLQQSDLHKILAPGKLALSLTLSDESSLICDEVVRVIPNKRLVFKGIWQQKVVYAKLFIDARAAHYFARDLSGVTHLFATKIATPALLFQGQTKDGAYVLVFEAVANSLNAEQVWQKSAAKARFNLAKNLVTEIAKHHNAGLLQTDLYLKNFLVTDDKIYTLDGDGIRKFTRLSQQQVLQNLSVLLSKFDVLEVKIWQADLLKIYAAKRSLVALPDAGLIKKMTNAHRQKIASNYADKKVFRQCTDVKKYALEGSWILASSDSENIDFSGNLDALLTPHNLLKDGNTCTVALVEMGGKKIVIKRYNIKNFWHGLSRAFRQTRAAISWANAHRLKLLDIATANPIALIENRNFGLKGKAYFLAENIDAPDVAQFFAKTRGKTQRAEAVKNIVMLFYKLYLLQISHGDMKATNIKMVGNLPVLIDLDSMQQHHFDAFALSVHVRDLCRFMQNWQDDNALYNAFVGTFNVIYEDLEPLEKAGIFNIKS
jgi:tRNA A-37 threonylcarbamoyl transferase component Bud32